MKVTTVDVGGEEVGIEVDGNGRFRAEYDGEHVAGNTLQEVKDQLAKMNRKALDSRAIPVTVVGIVQTPTKDNRWDRSDPFENGIGVINAKFRGRHARTSQWLLIAEGQNDAERKKFTISGYHERSQYQVLCRRLSLAETLEYIRLAKAAEFAKQQLDVWIGERRVDPKTLMGEVL